MSEESDKRPDKEKNPLTGGSDILEHFTPLDRSVLDGSDVYVRYFEHLRSGFNRLYQGINERTTGDSLESEVVRGFIQRFLNTIEALRMKYSFEDDKLMRIDLTESGFPNHIEFRELGVDLKERETRLEKIPDFKVLQQGILDFLFRNKREPVRLMRQMSKRKYYEMLSPQKMFLEYSPGELQLLKDTVTEPRRYLFSWGVYDPVTNRPLIYILIFDQPYDKKPLHEDRQASMAFTEQVGKDSAHASPLRVIASDLDTEFPNLYPKVLKRMDIGPLHSWYAKGDNAITRAIQQHFTESDYAFKFTSEVLFSIGEKRTKSFLSKGEMRQIFFIDQSNRETMERHVSEIHRYLMASHGLVQYLSNNHHELLDELAMPPITFV